MSIDDSVKDSFISNTKVYSNHNNQYTNHITNGLSTKATTTTTTTTTTTSAKYVSSIDESIDRTKYENDKNITLINGDSRLFGTTQSNKYNSEVDGSISDATAPSNPFTTRIDETNMPTLRSRNSQHTIQVNQSNGHNNPNNESIPLLTNGTQIYNVSNGKSGELRRDSINGFNSRRNSRINDENTLLNEKISDIFVNRNPGKLYNNTVGGSIYNNLLYNGGVNSNQSTDSGKRSNDIGYKNKAFFLHDNDESANDSGYGSKVYNIFSKQPTKLNDYGNGVEDDDDNSYLLVKIPSAMRKQSKKSIAVLDQTNAFDDDDLDKILG